MGSRGVSTVCLSPTRIIRVCYFELTRDLAVVLGEKVTLRWLQVSALRDWAFLSCSLESSWIRQVMYKALQDVSKTYRYHYSEAAAVGGYFRDMPELGRDLFAQATF